MPYRNNEQEIAVQVSLACISLNDDMLLKSSEEGLREFKRRRVSSATAKVAAGGSKGVQIIRNSFDKLLRGPAGLGGSATLWAMWYA